MGDWKYNSRDAKGRDWKDFWEKIKLMYKIMTLKWKLDKQNKEKKRYGRRIY